MRYKLLLLVIFLTAFAVHDSHAQAKLKLTITDFPDTVEMGQTYPLGIEIVNLSPATNYYGTSIDILYDVDTQQQGYFLDTLFTNNGILAPNDTLRQIFDFNVTPNYFKAGDNIVIVWPSVYDTTVITQSDWVNVLVTPEQPCEADFEFELITDTDSTYIFKSTSDDVAWTWDFGDGSYDWFKDSVVHTFPGYGEYEICLTVSDSISCWDTVCKNIKVAPNSIHEWDQRIDVDLFPVPVKDYLNVLTTERIEQVFVYDALGRELLHMQGNVTKVDVSSLAAGTYFVRLDFGDGKEQTSKILKE